MTSRWRVLLATRCDERAQLVKQALEAAQHRLVDIISLEDEFVLSVQCVRPDALIVETEESAPGLQAQIRRVMRTQPLPIVVFADRSNADDVRAAVRFGVSAYVVDGLRSERVLPVLEAALTRFAEFDGLRVQRDAAVARLAERRDVERAKGILMRRRDLAEQAAYDALRKMAMDRGARMIEVAQSVISAEELLARS